MRPWHIHLWMRPGVLDARTAEEVLIMDLFELFEPENERRNQRQPEDAPRQRGLRGFFRRWMDAVQEDDDRRTPRDSSRRRLGDDWD